MSKEKIELQPSEAIIDTWALNLIPPNGTKYNGKCTITNQRILFEALIDFSARAVLFKGMYFIEGQLVAFPKNEITAIETKKSFLSKRVILNMESGEQIIFDRGAMGIDDIVAAINSK